MKFYTYKLDLMILNVLALVLIVFLSLFTYVITGSLDFIFNFSILDFVFVILFMFFHELLHGIGFLSLGKVKRRNVVYGVELEKGIFYCMCKEKISKLNILIALLFPFFFIGILTYFIGIFFNINFLIFLSIFNMAGSVGDLMMFGDIFKMPDDVMYLDLDDTTSFTIISRHNLIKKKYFSIILDKYGKYNNSVKASNYTKITISKASWYIFIILFILLFVALVNMLGN